MSTARKFAQFADSRSADRSNPHTGPVVTSTGTLASDVRDILSRPNRAAALEAVKRSSRDDKKPGAK